MDSYIIDTNVLITASNKDQSHSAHHAEACARLLIEIYEERKRFSVDSLGLILNEYAKKNNRSGQPGIGDTFLKYIHDYQFNEERGERVVITADKEGDKGFVEFPDDIRLKKFDMEDRKFVAVAVKSKYRATIFNATDSDWWDYKNVFTKLGIRIQFLCPDLFEAKGKVGKPKTGTGQK